MIVTTMFFHPLSAKRFVDIAPLATILVTSGLLATLFTPVNVSLAAITIENIKVEKTISSSSRNDANLEPDILNLYQTLFKQTWELSPEIQVARQIKEQKSAEEYTALANRFSPQLDFEISQNRFLNKKYPLEDLYDDSSYADNEDTTEWSFDLDIPLYRRPLSLSVDVAKIEYDLTINNLEIKTLELDSLLHELLGQYMVASYKLHNLGNSILVSNEHVDKIQRGYDLRDQTKLALLRAQANLKELEARKDLNEQRRDTAFRALLDYTAIPENDPLWHWLNELLDGEKRTAGCINSFSSLNSSTKKMQPFLSKDATDETLRDFFIDNSFLYKEILLERNLGKTKAKKYTQQEWPALFLRGEFDRKGDTRFNDYEGEGSVGLVLSIPLFSGGTLFSTSKTEDNAARISSIEEYSAILKQLNSINNKKKTITSLQSIFEKQQIHLQQQQEIVTLSLKSYQIKQTSMQDLLTSKNRLIDAKNLLMQTTVDLGILLRQFAWELGTPFPGPPIPNQE